MTTTNTAVSVTGLTKRYGKRTAVDRLDLEIPAGVVAGFVGPNGAGKTTTMAMLLGLVRPDGGRGRVLGQPIGGPERYLGRVGALIEGPAFYGALTGAENLAYAATVAGHDPGRIPAVLGTVGLAGRGGDRYRSYSLGMKQRLGIAAALLGDPELLVLDEPANGLDPQGVREMRSLVGSLAGDGRTVVVSSHDLSELEQVCDWLVVVDAGRLVYQGSTTELLADGDATLRVAPERPEQLDALLAAVRGAGHDPVERDGGLLLDVDGRDVHATAAAVNRAAFGAGIVLAELAARRTTLEDRFVAMTAGGPR